MRWDTRLAKEVEVGKTKRPVRAHLEFAARQGDVNAIKRLREPPFPDALEYLLGYFYKLLRMRGGGFGPEPLTAERIKAAAELFDWRLTPLDCDALLDLDIGQRTADELWDDEKD